MEDDTELTLEQGILLEQLMEQDARYFEPDWFDLLD